MNSILGVQGGERKSVRAGAIGGPRELSCLVRNQDLDEGGSRVSPWELSSWEEAEKSWGKVNSSSKFLHMKINIENFRNTI